MRVFGMGRIGRAAPLLALGWGGTGGSPLADARRLAGEPAEKVELGSADLTMADDLHLVDARRREHERALDAYAVRDSTYFERPIQTLRAVHPDHHSLEDLDAFLPALDDA